MNLDPNVLWLSVSQHLKCFDHRLLSSLVKTAPIRRWEYSQTIDEPCCIESIVEELYGYLNSRITLEKTSGNNNSKVHLVGHGVSGIVGLLYANRYPEHVASLTLLSVAARPSVNWQAHYYALRQLLPCSRDRILAQMTHLLFGTQSIRFTKALSQLLAKDLDSSLTLHSLAHNKLIDVGNLSVPVLVCNGETDAVTGGNDDNIWQIWIERSEQNNTSFRKWTCPNGNHFFHYLHAATVAKVITEHWQQATQQALLTAIHETTEQTASEKDGCTPEQSNQPKYLTQLA